MTAGDELEQWLRRSVALPGFLRAANRNMARMYVRVAAEAYLSGSRPGAHDDLERIAALLGWALDTIVSLENGCRLCGSSKVSDDAPHRLCVRCVADVQADLKLDAWDEMLRLGQELHERDRKRAHLRPAFTYVLDGGDRRKVGTAVDLQKRVNDLRRAGGHRELELVHSVESPTLEEARAIEAAVRDELASHRIRGDWFRCSSEEMISTLDRVLGSRPIHAA